MSQGDAVNVAGNVINVTVLLSMSQEMLLLVQIDAVDVRKG